MRSLILLLILAFIACNFSGCSSASVANTGLNRPVGPYKKVYMLIYTHYRSKGFMDKFIAEVEAGLGQRKVDYKVLRAFDPDAVLEDANHEMTDFKPDIVIHLRLKKGSVYDGIGVKEGRGMNTADFDIRIIDFKKNDIIWKGEMYAHGDFGLSAAATKARQRFFSALERDSIIPTEL